MSAPAGWYNDGAGAIRFWDGSAWTAHTAAHHPAHPAGQMPLAQPYATYPAAQPTAPADRPGPPQQAIARVPPPVAQQPAHVIVPYGTPPGVARPTNGAGIVGFVVGLVSVFLPFLFGIVTAVVGLILSIVGLTRHGSGKGLAIAGLVLSIIGLVLIL